MSQLITNKKKDVRLTRKLEYLNLMVLNEETLLEMEEVKLTLNLEGNKEVKWEQRAKAN